VYRPAQDGEKTQFLTQMAHICSSEKNPMIIGEDFNIMKFHDDKNNSNFCPRWSILFNSIIDTLELREIEMAANQPVHSGLEKNHLKNHHCLNRPNEQ
jgi:hypothetical protein